MAGRTEYCVVQDLRDEGISASVIDDTRAAELITLACAYIDKITGIWFSSFSTIIILDGEAMDTLFTPVPIVEVTKVEEESEGVIDLGDIVVYNRVVPDDRPNPKIVWTASTFPAGNQNVEVTGKFGYVDYDNSTPITPLDIKRATIMLVARNKLELGSSEKAAQPPGLMKSESIDRYSYELADLVISGELSGDPEIDRILVRYKFNCVRAIYP